MPQGLKGFDRAEEGLIAPRADGETRGRAPKERGKADKVERDESSGADSLDVATGTTRDSEGGMTASLDVPDESEEGEEDAEEEEEEEGGLLLLLVAGVLPWGRCRRRGWGRCTDADP